MIYHLLVALASGTATLGFGLMLLYGRRLLGTALGVAACTVLFVADAGFGHRDHLPWDAWSWAVWAWMWWHSGGGDGTKRRLKAWARKFQGVRRTAPAAGAA